MDRSTWIWLGLGAVLLAVLLWPLRSRRVAGRREWSRGEPRVVGGGEATLTVVSVDGVRRKIPLIRCLRKGLAVQLRDAKEAFDAVEAGEPATFRGLSRASADALRRELESLGAKAEVS